MTAPDELGAEGPGLGHLLEGSELNPVPDTALAEVGAHHPRRQLADEPWMGGLELSENLGRLARISAGPHLRPMHLLAAGAGGSRRR